MPTFLRRLLPAAIALHVAAIDVLAAGSMPPSVTIAVVRDGHSAALDELDLAVRREIQTLGGTRFTVHFADRPEFDAHWDQVQVPTVLATALDDPAVDCVLVLGTRSVLAAVDPSRPISKPVLGGLVHDPDLVPLPIDAAGMSQQPNFAVVSIPTRVVDQLRELRPAVPFASLHVMVDDSTFVDRSTLEAWRAQLTHDLGQPVALVSLGAQAAETLARLDPSAETILLLPPVRMDETERRALMQGLTARRLRVLGFLGQPDVAAGALAGVLPETQTTLARRIAINFDQWISGVDVAGLPLRVPVSTQLFFNEATASAIGFAPELRALVSATLVDRVASASDTALTFPGALALALERNFNYRSRQAATVASRESVAAAQGALFPQIGASSYYQQIDEDRARNSGGGLAESSVRAGISVSQTIIDDETFTQLRTAREALKAADYTEQVERLDTINSAGQAYLQMLSALASLRATEENARVTAHNLELARLRQRVGTAGPEEGYRFESLAAQQHADLAEAFSQVERARVSLNQALGTDISATWKLQDLTAQDPAFAFSMGQVTALVSNRHQLERFRAFIGDFAVEHSPDLAAFEQSVTVQRLTVAQKSRRSYVPRVAASFDFSRTLTDTYAVALPGEPERNAWTFAVSASLPLFSGGSIRADARRAHAELNQLELSRDGLREAVIAQAQSSLYAIDSAFANIDLSRQSADLAARNLVVVQQKYEQGTVSIVTLLDAQNSAFAQRQSADIAVYRLFSAILTLERVFGWYEVLATTEEKAAWLASMKAVTGT